MKRILATALAAVLAAPSTYAAPNQDECAIWLCLPFGFAYDGCSGARKAFFKRQLEFKSPVPSWGSCSVGDQGDLEMVRERYALWDDPIMGPVLVRKSDCAPDEPGQEPPPQCLGTVRGVWLLDNGELMGEPYYYLKREKFDITGLEFVNEDDLNPLIEEPEPGGNR